MTSMSKGSSNDRKLMKFALDGVNKICADCGSYEDNDWASTGFGVLVCLECAGLHRELGVHITLVQSLTLDEWSDAQANKLTHGGNKKFHEYLAQEGLIFTGENPLGKKYTSPKVLYYSEIFKARIENREPKPYVEEEWKGLVTIRRFDTNSKSEKQWNPNTNSCELCGDKFSMFTRRHHCRRCGKCCCRDCAPSTNCRPIMEMGLKDPVRHCYDCYKSPLVDWSSLKSSVVAATVKAT